MKNPVGRLFCLIVLVTCAGCASGYHDYPCGRVSCDYCPPPALPWSDGCTGHCADSPGQCYADRLSAPAVVIQPIIREMPR